MSMIKGKNTRPEMIVRRYLFHLGFRFRVNVKRLPGTPDIVLRKYKTVIFVNGCFWHEHEGCPEFRMPHSHVEWWEKKLNRTKARDARVREALRAMGWNTMVVWECQLRPNERQATLERIACLLQKTYVESVYHTKFTPTYSMPEEAPLPKVAETVSTYLPRESSEAQAEAGSEGHPQSDR